MSQLAFPTMVEEISRNVRVMWLGQPLSFGVDPWDELAKRTIKIGRPIDVEEMLDRRGEEEADEYLQR